jgi:hypothetical protein
MHFLHRSYNWVRLDYLGTVLGSLLCVASFLVSPGLGVVVGVLGALASSWLFRWEMRRRSVYVHYDLDSTGLAIYQQVIEGFNRLASCDCIWVLDASTYVATLQGFKTHAGASALVKRRAARVGEGEPPWTEANITVSTVLARNQTLYFLPDCVLVYDKTGVGQVHYTDLQIGAGNTRFIERYPPADAQVVDYTWLHPNKGGGPDKRYANNYQIPVCLYGEVVMQSPSGLSLYLHTSRHDVSGQFQSAFKTVSRSIGPKGAELLRPTVEVNPEHFETLAQSAYRELIAGAKCFDGFLRRMAGEENDIIYTFVRILSIFGAIGALAAIVYLAVRAVAG